MPVKKRNVKGKFTIIPNSILDRPDLSWGAKGLLAYLISKPPNWVGRRDDILAHDTSQSKYSLRKLIMELKEKHYIDIITKSVPGKGGLLGRYYELQKIDDIETEEFNEVSNLRTSLDSNL